MKDAEYLREEYNKRFSGPAKSWTSEDIGKCIRLAGRVIRWAGLKDGSGLRMLDVGCATGFYTKAFFMKGFEATGLDYSDVAISKASLMHPECSFIHGNGFDPPSEKKYDLIFCRGFSGANTHDLRFVREWTDKYMGLLTDRGVFVFSYSTDYTGIEAENETVNWSETEIHDFISMVKGSFIKLKTYNEYYIISQLLLHIKGLIRRKSYKSFFYILFRRQI